LSQLTRRSGYLDEWGRLAVCAELAVPLVRPAHSLSLFPVNSIKHIFQRQARNVHIFEPDARFRQKVHISQDAPADRTRSLGRRETAVTGR
jgi:hypothetical protein